MGFKLNFLFIFLLVSTVSFAQPASFLVDKTTACENEDITFTNTSSYTGSGTVRYVWRFGDGASPATSNEAQPDPVHYTQVGLKSVTLEMYVDDVLVSTDEQTDLITVNQTSTLILDSGTETQSICLPHPLRTSFIPLAVKRMTQRWYSRLKGN